MKYVIYEYEEGIKQLFEKYPNLKQYFDNLTLDNDFMNKFINCVYNSVDYMNELIYKELHITLIIPPLQILIYYNITF